MKGQTHATTKIFWENDLSLVSSQVFDQVLVIFGSLEKEKGQWGARVLFLSRQTMQRPTVPVVSCPPTQHRRPFASWQHLTTRSLCRPFDVLFLLHRHHFISSSYTIATFVSFSCSSFTNTLLLLDSYFCVVRSFLT